MYLDGLRSFWTLLNSQNGGGKQPIIGILLGKTWTVAQKPSETKDGYKEVPC
jgi:hypothetical protein